MFLDVPPYLVWISSLCSKSSISKGVLIVWIRGEQCDMASLKETMWSCCRSSFAPYETMSPALLISLTKTPKILILSFARPSFLRVLANLPGCKVVQCLQLRHVVFVDSAICTGGHQHAIIGSPSHRTHLQQMCGWKLQAKKNKKQQHGCQINIVSNGRVNPSHGLKESQTKKTSRTRTQLTIKLPNAKVLSFTLFWLIFILYIYIYILQDYALQGKVHISHFCWMVKKTSSTLNSCFFWCRGICFL